MAGLLVEVGVQALEILLLPLSDSHTCRTMSSSFSIVYRSCICHSNSFTSLSGGWWWKGGGENTLCEKHSVGAKGAGRGWYG